MLPLLSVREMEIKDIDSIVSYWHNSDHHFLKEMGVDVSKIPPAENMKAYLKQQLELPIKKRNSYCVIWEVDGHPAGHCNTNPTVFGEEAFMHLHLWQQMNRQKGMGSQFLKLTVPHFFRVLNIKKLYSEPYALNPAPNKILEKAGFHLEKEYITVPGSLNFEQPVKRWLLEL